MKLSSILFGLTLGVGVTLAGPPGLASSFARAAVPDSAANLRELRPTIAAENYGTFSEVIEAARQTSQTLVDQTFKADPTVETVVVHILAEGKGTVVPLGLTRVSRTDWRSQPDIDLWSQWFGGSAQALLGFGPALTAQSTVGEAQVAAEIERPSRGRGSRMRRILSQIN
ncbi:MAG TPA: hypothetical protein V6D29_23095 [Leptolyngbyaceae cyanobacterium]